jgi:hypothetical protein
MNCSVGLCGLGGGEEDAENLGRFSRNELFFLANVGRSAVALVAWVKKEEVEALNAEVRKLRFVSGETLLSLVSSFAASTCSSDRFEKVQFLQRLLDGDVTFTVGDAQCDDRFESNEEIVEGLEGLETSLIVMTWDRLEGCLGIAGSADIVHICWTGLLIMASALRNMMYCISRQVGDLRFCPIEYIRKTRLQIATMGQGSRYAGQ